MNRGAGIAAVDIGTTKVCFLSGEMTERGPRIIATGTAASRGIKKGVVVNIDEAAGSIREAVSRAEAGSGTRVRNVAVGISGPHITGFQSNGVIGLQGREIAVVDAMQAIESAKTVYMPLDREMLHVITNEFILDGQKGITDPVGMSGVRLESRVFVITAQALAMQNLQRCCEQAGLKVLDMVFNPVAAAEAVLTDDEIQKGSVIVDIGGGTTDIAYFRDGSLVHAAVIGIGGLHITNDLAVCLRVSAPEAEKIKTTVGVATAPPMPKHERPELSLFDREEQEMSSRHIASIIQPRCEELFELVRKEIAAVLPVTAPCSTVLTGGSALLQNISRLASSVLGMPVRTGLPHGIIGMNNSLRDPAYATGLGLLAYVHRREDEASMLTDMEENMLDRMKKGMRKILGYEYKDFLDITNKKKKGVSYV